jgi:hypothetical protein
VAAVEVIAKALVAVVDLDQVIPLQQRGPLCKQVADMVLLVV